MNRIFKIEGNLLKEFSTKQSNVFQMINFYQNGEYINYDNTYVSLTRLSFNGFAQEIVGGTFPGQKVSSSIENIVTSISGITIIENFQFGTDAMIRGRAINNFNERSDFYSFILPTFEIFGASKINTGTTLVFTSGYTGDSFVYLVDNLSAITFGVIFTATNQFNSFFTDNNGISFQLYQRSTPTTYTLVDSNNPFTVVGTVSNPFFGPNLITNTGYYTKNDLNYYISGSPTTNITFDLTSFEGEFLIKGLFKWTNFTYFAKLANMEYYETNGYGSFPYGLYNSDRDYYFIYLKKAEKPIIYSDSFTSNILPLNVRSIIPTYDGQNSFPLPLANGGQTEITLVVSVNGLLLSTSEYSYSGDTLYINGGYILTTDIITVVSSNNINGSTVQTESYLITTISYTTFPTNGEKVIYNTDSGKYEYWLDFEVTNEPVFSINGQILTNNVDFYVSSSDKRRLIFDINLYVNDRITIFYNSVMNNGNNIVDKYFPLTWRTPTIANNNLGYFLVQVSNYNDKNFTNPVYSGFTFYQPGQNLYAINLPFSGGSYGQKFLVRVINHKIFYTVFNELIETINISDSITLTIKTNALNNY